MTFTENQKQAIFTHNKNVIVTAGAGSGKTRVLVERYLSLLEHNPDWKLTELVAITFTEKAAREMRDRVRLTIQQRIQEAVEGLERKRWREHEALLDSARIGTIHSLCAQILRSNPAEVPVDPGFEVLDESAAAILLDDAVEQSLAELVILNPPIARLISYYGVQAVKQSVKRFATLSESQKFCEAVPGTVEELWAKWQTEYTKASNNIFQNLRDNQEFADNLHWKPAYGWPQEDKLMDVWRIVHSVLEDLFEGETYAALEKLCEGIKLSGGTQKNWGNSKEGIQECKDTLKRIREIATDYRDSWPRPLDSYDEEAAEFLILWRETIEYTARQYKKLKDFQGGLDFDDLESLTVQLLKNYPEVAQRYSIREVRHLLVDEFQDTNAAQRDIVYKLCGIEETHAPDGRLFVVGDPKQSIYAFRGANVKVFQEVTSSVKNLGGAEVPLEHSFRTHQRLVEGLNALFEAVLHPESDDSYEVPFDRRMTAHRISENYHTAPIRLMLMEKPAKDSDADHMRRWEAYEVAQFLKNLHDSKHLIYDKSEGNYRPFVYDDAAILLRAMTGAPLYEEIFKNAGLPYLTIAGKGYYNRQEVWDFINLLKALHNRSDNLALATVLRSPMFGLSDDALFALRLMGITKENHNPIPLWEALQYMPEVVNAPDGEAIEFAREVLNELAGLAGRVPVAELISAALDKTAYDAILTALPDGDRRRGNIEKLLKKARLSGRVSLSDFTAYLGDLTAVDPREGEATLESMGAVKIMSVHASKGLEFPVVVLMDSNSRQRNPDTPALRLDAKWGASCKVRNSEGEWLKLFAYQQSEMEDKKRDQAEHKRIFYVAATRAQDMLILTGSKGKEPNNGSWLHLFQNAFEDIDLSENAESGVYQYDWGGVDVQILRQPPSEDVLSATRIELTGWDEVQAHLTGQAVTPLLLKSVPIERTAPAAHLTVSQLEKLGRTDALSGREFRNSVLHDSPAPVTPLAVDDTTREYYSQRAIGRIVHRALRVGLLVSQISVREQYQILRAYAWDEGITDNASLTNIVSQSLRLLQNFEDNNILTDAETILRETPFILRTETRIIHGQIDVLYKQNNQWVVLDYKTANIKPNWVRQHAKRYHIQVGAYARAVERRLGQTPKVQLYYLHPGTLITIPQPEWEHALAELDDRVYTALSV